MQIFSRFTLRPTFLAVSYSLKAIQQECRKEHFVMTSLLCRLSFMSRTETDSKCLDD